MKTLRKIICVIVILVALATSQRAYAPASVVNIPDPALQAAIRAALKKPVGDITVAEMESLTVLDAGRDRTDPPTPVPIQSLEGLNLATNLMVLKIDGSEHIFPSAPALGTSDLSMLSTLTKLESLSLARNEFTNITLPTGLASLRTLGLGGNRLTDTSFLNGLSGLRSLDLNGNPFANVDVLAGLTNLQTLDLNYCFLTNFSFLSVLTGLQSLDLSQNFVADLALPPSLTGLVQLKLFNMGLSNLTL